MVFNGRLDDYFMHNKEFLIILNQMIFMGKKDRYTDLIDDGEGSEVAQIARDYAKNITDKQVEELNEYINEE